MKYGLICQYKKEWKDFPSIVMEWSLGYIVNEKSKFRRYVYYSICYVNRGRENKDPVAYLSVYACML